MPLAIRRLMSDKAAAGGGMRRLNPKRRRGHCLMLLAAEHPLHDSCTQPHAIQPLFLVPVPGEHGRTWSRSCLQPQPDSEKRQRQGLMGDPVEHQALNPRGTSAYLDHTLQKNSKDVPWFSAGHRMIAEIVLALLLATLACTRLTPIGSKLSAPFEADGPPLRAASL